MLKLRTWLVPCALLSLIGCSASRSIEADYVFENVNVIPMNEEIVLKNRAVAVLDGKIVAIVAQSDSAQLNTDQRIDATGRYLMPGLADMHVHVRWAPQAVFNLFLANGITTVVNMGLDDGAGSIDHLALRQSVNTGRMTGPRYFISGPQLHTEQLSTLDQVTAALDRHVQEKFDVLKVHGDLEPEIYEALIKGSREHDIRVTGHAQHLMPLSESLRMDSIEHIEEFLYVSRDESFGKTAAGSLENFLRAYSANLELMENQEHRAAIVRDVAEADIFVAPSLIIYKYIEVYLQDDLFNALPQDERVSYLPPKVREEYLNSPTNEYRRDLSVVFGKNLGPNVPVDEHFAHNIELLSKLVFEMHKAGVPLLLSTDAFGAAVPGFSVHQELELLVNAGLTPYEALRTGTVNVATYLGEAETAGSVEVGKRADFVLLENNPLIDIKHAASIKGLFTRGRWYSDEDVANLFQEAKRIASAAH